jgi:hypothetical protein
MGKNEIEIVSPAELIENAAKERGVELTEEQKKEAVARLSKSIIEDFVLDSTTKVRTVKSLMRDVKNKKLNNEHIVQRKGQQWSKKQKELLIDSCLHGFVIPTITFSTLSFDKTNTLFVVDGKQRLETLWEYTNDVFKYNGKKFSELTEEEQDRILSTEISTVTYNQLTDVGISDVFSRLNNGTALSASQKTRGLVDGMILVKIKQILDNNFFTKCNITNGQIKKSEDEFVILQAAMLVEYDLVPAFSQSDVEEFVTENYSINEVIEILDKIEEKVVILNEIVEEKNKFLKKIHLPHIIAHANRTDEFKNRLLHFLTNYDNKEDADIQLYRSFCQGSTSQKQNVEGRENYWK